MKRLFSLGALLLVLTLALTPVVSAEALTLTDMTGREVVLPAPARRIVALTAGDVEILYALGAGQWLVGRGEYANYPLEALDVPSVQSGSETNLEKIIELKPDLVILATMAQQEEHAKLLSDAGIPVLVTNAADLKGTYEAIRLLGQATGTDDKAEELVAGMEAQFAELTEKAEAAGGGKSVYFEVSPLAWGLWSTGQGTYMQEIADKLLLENIFADIEGWKEVSQEQVLARDPDYIVTVAMYFGEGPTPVEEIASRAGWQNLKAVKNGHIFQADSDAISRPGPRLAEAAQALFDYVYGQK